MFTSIFAALTAALVATLTLANPIPKAIPAPLDNLSQRATAADFDFQIIMVSAGSQIAVQVPTDGWPHATDGSDCRCLNVARQQFIPCNQESVYNIATVKPGVTCTFKGYGGWLATQAYSQPVLFLTVGGPQPMQWLSCSTS